MNKILMLCTIVILGLVSTGCSTWAGVKKDSGEAWDSTKNAIHKATD